MPKPTIYTLGHSNRSIEDFLGLLETYGIQRLVDIRSLPGSRYNPQFNAENLKQSLAEQGIEYVPMKSLGGRRKPDKDSTLNLAWRHPAFRAYADYMQSGEFIQGLQSLINLAEDGKPTAIMCSEAVPWRCHRSMVGDALIVRGFPVEDIISPTSHRTHELTPWARVEGERITYPLPLDVV